MANTYTLISNYTVSGTTTDAITLSSIPQTYTDLIVKISSRQDLAQVYGVLQMYFNGTASGLSYKIIQATNGSVTSSGQTNINGIYGVYSDNGANSTSNTFSNLEFYISNYASSSINKSVSYDEASEGNASNQGYLELGAGLWASNSAINSITITTGGTSAKFIANSTFYLYGIKNS